MFDQNPVSLREAVHRVLFAAAAGLLTTPIMAPAAELPVPCSAGACAPIGPTGIPRPDRSWVTSGTATWAINGNTLNIQQTSDRAILNWASFNVGADGQVNFNQPSRTSVALNRIYQNSPSRIFGQVTANGEIYLVNPNGIIFGRTAKINAAGILASTLDISDQAFTTGIAAQLKDGLPALDSTNEGNFNHRVSVLDNNGNPLLGGIDADGNIVADPNGKPIEVRLTVQEGAQLSTTGANGRILLAAQNVDNSGSITAKDGQVVLAAGESVFLQAGSDPALRGLTVEVTAGGTVWNKLAGQISTPRGNATLVGFAVNQDGRVSATTSVAANGSIRLLARDNAAVTFPASGPDLQASRTGALVFGSNSVTSVVPELDDVATAVDDQPQLISHIEAMGHQVTIRSGAVVRANGGRVDISAVRDPSRGALDATDIVDGKLGRPEEFAAGMDGQSQLRIESGATIDVSGSDVTLPMSRNLVSVELRASEFANSPDQRDGALRGQSVVVDARTGTPLGDVTGAIAAIPKSIAERTSRGGTATFVSDGDVVANAGAQIDVSGGAIRYESGLMATTKLIGADGKVYDIGSADPARTYVGLINPVYRRVDDRWGQIELIEAPGIGRMEPGYLQGQAAGTLQFVAPTMLLNGTFVGNTVAGPYQRTSGRIPSGGRFIVGLQGGVGVAPSIDYRAPSVTFAQAPPSVIVADGAALPLGQPLQLPTDFLHNGFTSIEIYSNGAVTVPREIPLQLAAGSKFTVNAQTVNVLADLSSPGGQISLVSHDPLVGAVAQQPGINIGADVTLDVRGTWTNDSVLDPAIRPVDPQLQNGGSISLALAGTGVSLDGAKRPAAITLADNVQLRVSGGAAVSRSGAVTPGAGGTISLLTNGLNSQVRVGNNVGMDAFGVLGAAGGVFGFTAPKLVVEDGSTWASAQAYDPTGHDAFFRIGSALFSDYGFATINLTAARPRHSSDDAPADPDAESNDAAGGDADILRILPGAHIDARVKSLQLDSQASTRPGSANIADFSTVMLADPYLRTAANVTFTASLSSAAAGISSDQAGDLRVGAGALLNGDIGSRFSFASLGSAFIDGAIRAPGGTITAGLTTPGVDQDAGFIEQQRLQIGSTAVLDVSGAALFTPNDQFLSGKVVDGGSINLVSQRGSVVVANGAHLDISGASALLDVATGDATHPYDRHTVASSGGALLIRAPESIGLYGTVDAFAGSGDIGKAAAGSLAFEVTRQRGFSSATAVAGTFPTAPRTIDLVVGPVSGSALPPNGSASISQEFIAKSGADALVLRADDEISIRAGMDLSLARSLTFDTPLLSISGSGDVHLAAPYVSIGSSIPLPASAQSVVDNSRLTIDAGFIDVIGSSVLGSMSQATLHSTGDIRLRGTVRANDPKRASIGDLTIAGDLSLEAARIYGATATQFTLQAGTGVNGRLQIAQTEASAGTPLSVGSSLRLIAPDIIQGGTLLAPFGSISIEGSHSVSLLDGSTTSVSGKDTLFPYGRVAIGEWDYVVDTIQVPVTAVPDRQVSINSDAVNIAPGASVDVSGGGDLYAYEWVPGTGGRTDALAPGATPGLYAILPSLQGQYAPYDPQEYAGSELMPGQSIYLSGLGDLPAGTYPLLPARYALLPGAYLVSAVPGTSGIAPGSAASLRDGTRVIAGYTTFGNTQLGNTQYSGFAIRPGSYGRALAQYDDSLASDFFAARAARLELGRVASTADAGTLSLFAGTQLDARGKVLTDSATGGRDATIDVSALRLAVVAGDTNATDGEVQIGAAQLAQWNPGTLILGGHRNAAGELDVKAQQVRIADGTSLALDQIVLAGLDRVTVESGATVASRSASQTGAMPQLDSKPLPLGLTGAQNAGAAILAVSDLAQVSVQRTGAPAQSGSVDLQSGAKVASRGAITIDAPAGATLLGDVDAKDARLSLGASRLIFGSDPVNAAMVIGTGLEASLRNVRTLNLTADSIEFDRDVTIDLSGKAGSEIVLDAASLSAQAPQLKVNFKALQMTLSGADVAAATPPANDGNSTLELNAANLQLGPGYTDIGGFSLSTWIATQQVTGRGTSHTRIGGNLEVKTPLIAFGSDADTSIDVANGTALLAVAPSVSNADPDAPKPPPAPPLELGGAFRLAANRIDDTTSIVAPSGLVTMQSTGDLLLGDGASIDVAGRLVTVNGRTVGSNGGTIALAADRDLTTNGEASLAMSGAGDSSAGRLSLYAGGAGNLAASLSAHAGTGAVGGGFDLFANSLGDFAALNEALQEAGFTDAQRIRVATGDLVLAADTRTTARAVDLVADTGSVRIGGTISAPAGDTRGAIRLYGATGVEIFSGGALHADSAGTRGGTIELGAATGNVNVAAGSVISATGSAINGTLSIRTPVSTVTNDVMVGSLAGDLSGLSSVTLAPVFTYSAPTELLTDAELAPTLQSASDFVTANAGHWTPVGSTPVLLRPDIEVVRVGSLTLDLPNPFDPSDPANPLDLSAWRFAGQPGSLTIRATQSLQVNRLITDGVVPGLGGRPDLAAGASSSITLTAGADLSSIDPNATLHGRPAADLNIAATVRTGTGSISLNSARDIAFGAGASVYTTGLKGAASQVLQATLVAFPDQGGSIAVRAGQNVIGSPVDQAVSTWQFRGTRATATSPLSLLYGVDAPKFGWSIGALGGGDVTVAAGNDVRDLSAATADSAIVAPDKSVQRFGGGSMVVNAGGDIDSSLFFGGQGALRLHADGALGSDRTNVDGSAQLGTSLALGNTRASIEARNGILLERALNPTVLFMPGINGSRQSFFFTYGADSALQLRSAAGDVSIAHGADLQTNFQTDVSGSTAAEAFSIYPSTLIARAYSGDIIVDSPLWLFASATGQLDLLASRDITAPGANQITMSDAAAAAVPVLGTPNATSNQAVDVIKSSLASRYLQDTQPALITAGRDMRNVTFQMAKAAQYLAGRDIADVSILGQNLRPTDVTLISAGRDFTYASSAVNQTKEVSLGGPGELAVLAGRDVDLGFTKGITTTGRTKNASLRFDAGANVTVMAGLGAATTDYSGFMDKVIATSADYIEQLAGYLGNLAGSSPDTGTALATFQAMGHDAQRQFIDTVFFSELVQSGKEANTVADAGFRRGYAAIDALFPGSRAAPDDLSSPSHGNINMAFSRIYTLAGGDISLLAPSGLLNVGLANPPPTIANRDAALLGIVAQGEGSVHVFTDKDVLVNSSRIFTLLGGDIAVWSTHGNIDAGRGAKSSLSAPPPTLTIDENTGIITVNFAGAVTGSGIRTIETSDDIRAGNVDLIAPVGFVNAGDAGIGSAGNLNIAAQHVIGLDNIQVGGASTGVPAETGGLGASLAGVTAAASSSTNAANDAASEDEKKKDATPRLAQAALSWLDVFVLGLGEDNCKQDDVECLKRQQ